MLSNSNYIQPTIHQEEIYAWLLGAHEHVLALNIRTRLVIFPLYHEVLVVFAMHFSSLIICAFLPLKYPSCFAAKSIGNTFAALDSSVIRQSF